jgi:hypothetical protein
MTNTTFFAGLPSFDDDDLDGQMTNIMTSDRDLRKQLVPLLQQMSWYEKMAIGQIAYNTIDSTHTNLIRVTFVHGEVSLTEAMTQAIAIIKKFSPEALAELAGDILLEEFEIWEVNNEANNVNNNEN